MEFTSRRWTQVYTKCKLKIFMPPVLMIIFNVMICRRILKPKNIHLIQQIHSSNPLLIMGLLNKQQGIHLHTRIMWLRKMFSQLKLMTHTRKIRPIMGGTQQQKDELIKFISSYLFFNFSTFIF